MNRKDSLGFTLVELMLSMAFLSALLLAIAMTVIQISNTYNRGTMLKDVNQSGRSISAELQRSISESAPFSIVSDEGVINSSFVDKEWGGRLCISQYAYIWNYGNTLNKTNPLEINRYSDTGNKSTVPIHFVKVRDAGASYCLDPSKPIDFSQSVELLLSGDHSLAIQKFDITSPDTAKDDKARERLYSLDFYIGTNDSMALNSDASACKQPGEDDADIARCSIQEFNIAIRAGNSVR